MTVFRVLVLYVRERIWYNDICKTILTIKYHQFSMFFAYFHSMSPPKATKMDNFLIIMEFCGIYLSKCPNQKKKMPHSGIWCRECASSEFISFFKVIIFHFSSSCTDKGKGLHCCLHIRVSTNVLVICMFEVILCLPNLFVIGSSGLPMLWRTANFLLFFVRESHLCLMNLSISKFVSLFWSVNCLLTLNKTRW